MALFQPALELVLKNEGGITDNKNDRGGITNMGISLRFLRCLDLKKYDIYEVPTAYTIINLTKDKVAKIYEDEFWKQAPFEKIEDQDIANVLFDSAVSLGIAPAVKCCQRAIWAVWKHYYCTADDGVFGEETLKWIARCNPLRLISALRSERCGEYRLIEINHFDQTDFLPGWLKRGYEA